MSENELPEPKPDLLVKAWGFMFAATSPLGVFGGLAVLAMVLSTFIAIRLFGH